MMSENVNSTIHVVNDDCTLEEFIESRTTASGREEPDSGFFVVDFDEVISKHQEWLKRLPRIKPFYAVKCNDDRMLVYLLHKLGFGFDCASKRLWEGLEGHMSGQNELLLVLGMGVQPSDIVYAHTCKQNSFISFAAEAGVSLMTFDNETELQKIKARYPDARLLLRFRPNKTKAHYEASGLKFGSPLSNCSRLLEAAKSLGLNVVGVSFHIGSGCSDASTYSGAVESARYIFDLGKQVSFKFNILDVGGGFPGDDCEFPFEKICSVLNASLDQHFPVKCGVDIIAEPGRYFATVPFTCVNNVIAIREVTRDDVEDRDKDDSPVCFTKDSPDTGYMYYIDDGLYGSFNEILVIRTPELNTGIPLKKQQGVLYPSSIWGQSCDPRDFISKDAMLPKLSVGDWIYFLKMGAYTTAVSSGFNGFAVNRCKYHFIRQKTWQKMKDVLSDFEVSYIT